jgi:malate synthase
MEALLEASIDVGVEINTGRTKYMFTSCHQSAEQIHNIKQLMYPFNILWSSDIWERYKQIKITFAKKWGQIDIRIACYF